MGGSSCSAEFALENGGISVEMIEKAFDAMENGGISTVTARKKQTREERRRKNRIGNMKKLMTACGPIC
ncbi:hypothetical protein GUJ93_ZPchr0006g45152 [Zizania palustris]|uniref:Uncharacterized protein n=1 Tax=Zizania palustris TaxID=103762 RepID=A0A8J5SLV6_ZIZPA|nr:hypothetical protein GUJ93_ZPchr0006g45152 [Zizania palustris]